MAEYIEREAVLNDLRDSYHELQKIYNGLRYDEERAICGGQLSTFLECILRLKDAPAADVVEVKRGRWENIVYNPVLRKMEATCSSCKVRGEIRVKGNCCGFVVPNSDFCPECGADMREVNDAN